METTTRLSPWLTLCISERTTSVSRCCWVPCDDYGWEVIGDFKMVVIHHGLSRRFQETSLFPLPLWQLWHYTALSQKRLATTDQVLCGEEQCQGGAADRTSDVIEPWCSWQRVSSFQAPPSSLSKAVRGKGQGWYLPWTADQEDHRMWRVHQAAEQEAENGLEQFHCSCSWLPW